MKQSKNHFYGLTLLGELLTCSIFHSKFKESEIYLESRAMGNRTPVNSKALDSGFLAEYESKSGRLIIQAIRADNVDRFQVAIEKARQEFIKPTKSSSNDAEYEIMVRGMLKYLTKMYDIGEGVVFTKTLLEYCDFCDSVRVKQELEREIEKYRVFEKRLTDKHPPDRITMDRAKAAKERLKAFQETRNDR